MKLKQLLIPAALVVALATPVAAHADYTISRREAQSDVRDFVHYRYGLRGVAAVCKAQYISHPDYRRYDYHRWVCGWSDGECSGVLRITGHTGRGWYGALVLSGARCE